MLVRLEDWYSLRRIPGQAGDQAEERAEDQGDDCVESRVSDRVKCRVGRVMNWADRVDDQGARRAESLKPVASLSKALVYHPRASAHERS